MNKKEILSEYFKSIGGKGGTATVKKHGKGQMKKWGKLGGRPVGSGKKRRTK